MLPGPYGACTSEKRRKNLKIIFDHTSIIPFKWRGKYLCFFCNKNYTDYIEFRKHTKSHGLSNTQDYLLKLVKGSSIEIKIDITEIVCGICKESFDRFEEIIYHLIDEHRLEYDKDIDIPFREHRLVDFICLQEQCKKCGSRFASLSLLNRHLQMEHVDNDGNFKCRYCCKVLHSIIEHRQHTSKCKVKIISQAEPNPLLLESQKKSNLHKIRQNIQCVLNMSTAVPFKFSYKYFCFYCSKKFFDFDELRGHTSMEHPVCDLKQKCMNKSIGERFTLKIDISTLACKLCGTSMTDLEALLNHLIQEHNANYDKSITGCVEPFRIVKDNIPCPICPDKVFRYFGILLRHMNSEHNNNNRICDFCGRSFRNVANLNIHITHAHTGSCSCDVCGIKFKNQWCLARHKAKTHDAKDFKCSKCSATFNTRYHKQKHLIEKHNIGHKCDRCDKMFTRNSFMKDHVRRTHLKEKNVSCSICNEKFFDNYLLKLHMVKHQGDRKFSCIVCDKSFLRRSNLAAHMEMHKKYGHIQK